MWVEEKHESGGDVVKEQEKHIIEVLLPGGTEYVRVNKNQVIRVYKDDEPRLMICVDEVAELLTKSGLKTEAGKEEDQLKQECIGIIQSLTQLGRSAGITVILCSQRADTRILPGFIQNNPLCVSTKICTSSLESS